MSTTTAFTFIATSSAGGVAEAMTRYCQPAESIRLVSTRTNPESSSTMATRIACFEWLIRLGSVGVEMEAVADPGEVSRDRHNWPRASTGAEGRAGSPRASATAPAGRLRYFSGSDRLTTHPFPGSSRRSHLVGSPYGTFRSCR